MPMDKRKCTSCSACMNICPTKAVMMKHTIKNTYMVVDEEKCIDCRLCESVCPILSVKENENSKKPHCYAAASISDGMKWSASGGIFFELASLVINQEGIVFGAAFDKEFTVNIVSTDCMEGLYAIQSSKYVESNINYSYTEAKHYLDGGRYVLFAALPCQIAGLKSFLKKDYDNLLCVDIICHGTPSELIHKDYLEYYQQHYGVKINEIRHRYKGGEKWNPMRRHVSLFRFSDRKIVQEISYDGYLCGFAKNLFFKDCCYECEFNKLPRVGDISLGDYTGLGIEKKSKYKWEKGVNAVLVNNYKGRDWIDKIHDNIYIEDRPISEMLVFNKNIFRPTRKTNERELFLEAYSHENWNVLRKHFLDRKFLTIITNHVKDIVLMCINWRIVGKIMYYKGLDDTVEQELRRINDE